MPQMRHDTLGDHEGLRLAMAMVFSSTSLQVMPAVQEPRGPVPVPHHRGQGKRVENDRRRDIIVHGHVAAHDG